MTSITFILLCVFVMVVVKRSDNEKLKNYTSTIMIVLCAIIAVISLFVFLQRFISEEYKSFYHQTHALISPLFPIAISVTLFFARESPMKDHQHPYLRQLLGIKNNYSHENQ